jgi:hypothetical protein
LSINSTSTSTITTANATSPMKTPPCNTRDSQYEYYTQNTTHFWNYILRYYTIKAVSYPVYLVFRGVILLKAKPMCWYDLLCMQDGLWSFQ